MVIVTAAPDWIVHENTTITLVMKAGTQLGFTFQRNKIMRS